MKNIYVDFINLLHGYLIRNKEIHWAGGRQHKLCDDIESELMELEDRFAECSMGIDDSMFKIGDLKPLLPNSTDLSGMFDEMENDVLKLQKRLTPGKESGLLAICDELIEFCCKNRYLAKVFKK